MGTRQRVGRGQAYLRAIGVQTTVSGWIAVNMRWSAHLKAVSFGMACSRIDCRRACTPQCATAQHTQMTNMWRG